METYTVTWHYASKPDQKKKYQAKADDGFEAEKEFLQWAGAYLAWPVKVVSVERVVI